MELRFIVCPTIGCGNYYGSSAMAGLDDTVGKTDGNFTPRPESQWFKRSECPDCRARGLKVQRQTVGVELPVADLTASPAA